MLCEICKQNEATIPVKLYCDGALQETRICPQCAEKGQATLKNPIGFAQLLLGMGSGQKEQVKRREVEMTCPECGMSRSQFKKDSRLGCPACYEAFEADLEPLLESLHRDTTHRGKVPACEKLSAEMASLQESLELAVAEQDFEEAARLRDALRDLKAAAEPQIEA